jgi:hypothetical protein
MPNAFAFRAVVFSIAVVFFASLWLAWQPLMGIAAAIFLLLAALVQAFILNIPILILYGVRQALHSRGYRVRTLDVLLLVLSIVTVIFMVANYKLREMYGFYFNFFVFNLLVTPGGIEAMGASASTNQTIAIAAVLIAIAVYLLLRMIPFEYFYPAFLARRRLLLSISVLLFVQAGWYAFSEFNYNRVILGTADRIVWYIPVTARSFFENSGFEINRPEHLMSDPYEVGGSVSYPTTPEVNFTKPYNIVWLVSESLRADMLDPTIMPNTWRFAQHSQRFNEHYSGGNGTRMGMFAQFYGLYGQYWFDFLYANRPPLMMELIKKNNYTMMAYTSSRFSYPEFDKTIFAGLQNSQLQSYTEGEGWERDRKNVDDMLEFIDSAKAPFFSFMFFESAHANYYFPKESIIRDDYIEDFNYLTVDVPAEIERIRNRYINATHHLDSQLGRVYDALESQGLLDNTIVIVTGDHGEEFMENGRWGHNSTFSQQQIRVPLLIHVPGKAPRVINAMTSHHDLPASILSLLGVDLDPSTYSFGSDLLSPQYDREYTVISDWHGDTLVTPEVKMVFSKKGAAYAELATTTQDESIDLKTTTADYKTSLGRFAREVSRFYH